MRTREVPRAAPRGISFCFWRTVGPVGAPSRPPPDGQVVAAGQYWIALRSAGFSAAGSLDSFGYAPPVRLHAPLQVALRVRLGVPTRNRHGCDDHPVFPEACGRGDRARPRASRTAILRLADCRLGARPGRGADVL